RWPRAASACRPARGAPDVDFRPTPAQQLLAATAREMLRKHCPPEVAQRVALDARGLDPGLWRQLAELGWPGLLIPSELGGSDGSLLDVVVLVEEMGRAALPGPFAPAWRGYRSTHSAVTSSSS